MASPYEIVQALHQASQNAYDGSQSESFHLDKKPIPIGLKRDEGHPLIDSRVIDGFQIRISGQTLILTYSCPTQIQEYHDTKKFVAEMETTLKDIVKFLKSEAKKVNGSVISLTPLEDEVDIFAWGCGNRREVRATRKYKIGNMGETEDILQGTDEKVALRDMTRKFLELGKNDRWK